MKNNMYKKIVICILFIILLIAFNIEVYANQEETDKQYSEIYKIYQNLSDEEKSKYEIIPKKYDVTVEEFESRLENKENTSTNKNSEDNFLKRIFKVFAKSSENETETIPVSYDLRSNNPKNLAQHGNIQIRVENQGDDPLCWTFASLGAIRTNLALKGYNNYITPDLSERHMNYMQSELFGKDRKLTDGGRFYEFVPYLLNNSGPISEEKLPYHTQIDTSNEEVLNRIANIEPDYYVHKIVEFPSIYKVKQSNDTTKIYNGGKEINETKMEEIRNQIKTHIMNNGGVYCFIRWDSNFMGHRIGEPYRGIDGEYAQYDDGSLNETEEYHTVTIVGWDDNYDKNKINAKNSEGEIVHPSSNGAYLALNSWGEEWGENGYFWISYEDAYVEAGLIGIEEVNQDAKFETYTFKSQAVYEKIKDYCKKYKFAYETNDDTKTIKLTDLSLYFVGYTDFTEIMNLEKMDGFDLSNCNMTDEDLQELLKNDLPNLKKINLSGNNITNPSAINNLTGLKEINLSNNYIQDISMIDQTKYKTIDLSGQKEKRIMGDITGDNKINIRDIIRIRKYIANPQKWNLTDEEKILADVDENNRINIRDIIKIRKYIAASSSESIKANHSNWIWE